MARSTFLFGLTRSEMASMVRASSDAGAVDVRHQRLLIQGLRVSVRVRVRHYMLRFLAGPEPVLVLSPRPVRG